MLLIESLKKSYGIPGEDNYREVLSDLGFFLAEGESAAVLGPSGSGKTTLLNIIGALDSPDEGEVAFKGNRLSEMAASQLDNFRNREIGFIFQSHLLLPQLTLWENILLPAIPLSGREKGESEYYAEELLKETGIWDHRDKLPGKMSGGECQRAAVVRAMINKPALLLADEPTGALDEKTSGRVSELLMKFNQEHKVALIVVTHSAGLASEMESVYRLENGNLHKS